MKITKNGKTRRFSSTFDIVLTHVPVFVPAGRRPEFGPYVKGMRDVGVVAWHRWSGEDRNGDGSLASVQNEMHCIDPAYPFIKPGLAGQITKFINKGSGGNDYEPEPDDPTNPFTILDSQIIEVEERRTTKRAQYRTIYPEAEATY